MRTTLRELAARVDACMPADRRRLVGRLYGLEKLVAQNPPAPGTMPPQLEAFTSDLEQAEARLAARRARVPAILYPEDLPISQRREEIKKAISENQVVVICGETGSGKTTQIPKICLELGRGVNGMIGHTQPRRIAARSVAQRIAEEINTRLGDLVGYKVRFGDKTSPGTFIKLMTDGILLAETQGDRNLDQYDTLIIDEAHERSLNIDFLLGYIRTLLPRRPDLKVIVTSATIDPQRFAEHFKGPKGPAPIVMVSGRTYPVEVLYRPPHAEEALDELDDDMQRAILHAVDEAASYGDGDILLFLSGEREIRETAELLQKHHVPGSPSTAILPLYAKLSAEDQMRVFQPHTGRRIVLSTNVAETSLTVPGIRYVVDVGFARISRYSPRTKVQRLEIESISRASADQRKGRCGRIGPGVCVRLYTEEDYNTRTQYTDPEIVRANLASVILQMASLRLGDVERFPFIDPPDPRAIRDGYETLHELGAVDEKHQLTPLGKDLARLPIDPRIGRMILAAQREKCLDEVLIIASALSVQDPRERPMEKSDRADEMHAEFKDASSDFASYLKLWAAYHDRKRHLSGSKLRKWCKENFLSFVRLREWEDIHRQLTELIQGMQQPDSSARERGGRHGARGESRAARGVGAVRHSPAPPSNERSGRHAAPQSEQDSARGRNERAPRSSSPASAAVAQLDETAQTRYNRVHRALLTGLLGNIGIKTETGEYAAGRGVKFNIFPGSALFRQGPKWVMAAELVRTTKLYARTVAAILPEWVEELGAHLVKRTYSEPHWSRQAGRVLAYERVTINGLELVARRRVHYGPIDPVASREIFVHHALVEGDLETRAPFYSHNQSLLAQVRDLEVRSRKNNLLADAQQRFDFYDGHVPKDIITAGAFERWRFEETKKNPRLLFMSLKDLIASDAVVPTSEMFPDEIDAGPVVLPVVYRLEPGHEADGVTVRIPVEALGQLSPEGFVWLVPGHLVEKVETIVRGLPKDFRRVLPPASALAQRCTADLKFGQGSLIDHLRNCILKATTVDMPREVLASVPIPAYLRMRFEVLGADGKVMAAGRDLSEIKAQLRQELKSGLLASEKTYTREGIKQWDFGDLPERVEIDRFGVAFAAYPGIVDLKASVALKLFDTFDAAQLATRAGTRRLFMFEAAEQIKRQTMYIPGVERMGLQYATLGKPQQFKELMRELIADRAFIGDQLPVRTEKEFAFRVGVGIDRLGASVEEVTTLMGAVMTAYQATQYALAQAPKAPAFAPNIDDIRDQLGALTSPDFLVSTPYQWLRHYPRYFQAVQLRIQKMSGPGVARDARNMAEVTPLWLGYRELEKRRKELGLNESKIIEYRWMVEELRVSLFAQELRTSVPVSVKRLHELWEAIVKGA